MLSLTTIKSTMLLSLFPRFQTQRLLMGQVSSLDFPRMGSSMGGVLGLLNKPLHWIKPRFLLLALLMLALYWNQSFAQTQVPPIWPDEAAINQALQSHPLPVIDPGVYAPNSPPLLQTQPKTPVLPSLNLPRNDTDIADIVKKEEALRLLLNPNAKPAPLPNEGTAPQLRIFISLYMPDPSLRHLVEESQRVGAVLMLRGLYHQSMRETRDRISQLNAKHSAAWEIDPRAFTDNAIRVVPSFVLVKYPANSTPALQNRCSGACLHQKNPWQVTGDVSVAHALTAIANRYPEARSFVTPLLQRLNH